MNNKKISRQSGTRRSIIGRMGRPVLHDRCTIAGCKTDHYAKGLCRAHYQKQRSKAIEQKIGTKKRRSYKIISQCCKKKTIEGKEHDHGKQYCSKCKEPCYWRYNVSL